MSLAVRRPLAVARFRWRVRVAVPQVSVRQILRRRRWRNYHEREPSLFLIDATIGCEENAMAQSLIHQVIVRARQLIDKETG